MFGVSTPRLEFDDIALRVGKVDKCQETHALDL